MFVLFCVFMYIASMYVCALHVCPVMQRSKEGISFFGTGVIYSCELSSECWGLNLDPL